jgi:hypothetical protein
MGISKLMIMRCSQKNFAVIPIRVCKKVEGTLMTYTNELEVKVDFSDVDPNFLVKGMSFFDGVKYPSSKLKVGYFTHTGENKKVRWRVFSKNCIDLIIIPQFGFRSRFTNSIAIIILYNNIYK